MYPKLNASNNIIIEWYEKTNKKSTPIHHYFQQQPIKLQLHPKDSSIIIRAHFLGKMPKWINYYINSFRQFKVNEVNFNNEVGWFITSWENVENSEVILSPTLDGAIDKFAEKIPDFLDVKDFFLEHRENVYQNLTNFGEIFASVGVSFRKEEIIGVEGCLSLDKSIFLSRETDEDDSSLRARYESDGKLIGIVKELTHSVINPNLNDEEEQEVIGSLTPDISAEEGQEILGNLTPDINDEEEQEVLGSLTFDISAEEEQEVLGSLTFDISAEEEQEVLSGLTRGKEDPFCEQGVQLVIIEYDDKRKNIIKGQLSLAF